MSKTDAENQSIAEVMAGIADTVGLTYARAERDEATPVEELATYKEIVVVLHFAESGFGFGEVTIVQTPAGLFMDGEYMDDDRIKKYLCKLVDNSVREYDKDPERHALYNREMGRSCGEGCKVCYPAGGGQ